MFCINEVAIVEDTLKDQCAHLLEYVLTFVRELRVLGYREHASFRCGKIPSFTDSGAE
jgi:hypothetical protein